MKRDKYGTLLESITTFEPSRFLHLFIRNEDGTIYLDRHKAIKEVIHQWRMSEEVATVRFIRVLIHQFEGSKGIFTDSNLTYYLEVNGDRIFGGVYNPITKEKETHRPVAGCIGVNLRGCRYRYAHGGYEPIEMAITKLTNNSIESAES